MVTTPLLQTSEFDIGVGEVSQWYRGRPVDQPLPHSQKPERAG